MLPSRVPREPVRLHDRAGRAAAAPPREPDPVQHPAAPVRVEVLDRDTTDGDGVKHAKESAPRERKPQPRVVSEVCSLCGLDWKRHGKTPTTETCIELLLDEVRSLNARIAAQPISRPYPYPVPYPQPYPVPRYPWSPWWGTTRITYGTTSSGLYTPASSSALPSAISATSTC